MLRQKFVNEYVNSLSKSNMIKRAVWNIVWTIFFRPFPSKLFRAWRNFILRIFGAKIHKRAGVYASCRIWAPWNLELRRNAWLGPNVNCYNIAKIILEEDVTVSQGTTLYAASHNFCSPKHELIVKSIVIRCKVWVAAEAFIGMGVIIGEGAVVGARACVFKNVEPWTVVGGNPAKFIKKRIIKE